MSKRVPLTSRAVTATWLLLALGFVEPVIAQRQVAHPPYVEGELLLKFNGGPRSENAGRVKGLMKHEVKRDFDFIGWQRVKLPQGMTVQEALPRYKNLPEVLAAEPNYEHQAINPASLSAPAMAGGSFDAINDSLLDEQYGLQRVGASAAWGITNGGTHIVVAVIDTGINYRHEDLSANMWRNPGEIPGNGIDDDGNGYIDDVYGIDVADDGLGNDSDPNDEGIPGFYHGSACAGVIGAVGNNGKGIAGMTWAIQLMAVRGIKTNNFISNAEAIDALNYLVLMKRRGVNLRVVNMSWGGGGYSQAQKDAHDRVAAEGIVQVVAAGNDNSNNDVIPSYPDSYQTSNLVSVAASDSFDFLAPFSNYGRTNVDLAAPGVAVIMTAGPETNSYTIGSGTSFAAPHTVGAAALLIAAHPQLTAAEVKRVLMESVDVLPAFTNKMVSNGRLNAARALNHSNLVSGVAPFVISEPPNSTFTGRGETWRRVAVALSNSVSLSVSAHGSEPLHYQWRRFLVFDTFADVVGATNATLSFASVAPADAGFYVLVVSNAFGSVTNEGVELAIQSSMAFTKITSDPLVTDTGDAITGSWGDYDGNGYPDVFISKWHGQNNALFRNNGNGSFTKITSGNIVTDGGDSYGAAWGDFDNDGDLDLFVPNGTNQNNLVYRNDGSGAFTKNTNSALATGGTSFNGAWADYDNDGWLDLFVSNGGIVNSQNNFLFHNDGNDSFTRVADGSLVNDGGASLGAAWGDFNNDGLADLFVANFEYQRNFLYQNNAHENAFAKFTDSPVVLATGRSFASGAWADYDNDGYLDLLVGAVGRSILYYNDGSGNFRAAVAGDLGQDFGDSLGVAWGDFDNDGFIDAFVANNGMGTRFLYRNNGNFTFTRIMADALLSAGSGAGCEAVDYNNDGFLDLFVTGFGGGRNTLLRNNGNTNRWLTLTLRGTESNRDGIGAKIKLRATIGGATQWQMREISGSGGWGSRNGGRAAFGLGDATNVDLVRIEWPSGIVHELTNVQPNQFLTVTEPGCRIIRQPHDVFPRPGANTNLTALAFSDQPTVTYQWLFNGSVLTGENNPVLSVMNARWEHQGDYAVAVSDGLRSVTSSVARLTLLIDPLIMQQPLSRAVLPGAAVTLSVVITNTATLPLAVRWRRNTTFLSGFEPVYERILYLTITNAQPPATLYSVIVTNLGRTVISSQATLSFLTDTNSNGLPDDWESTYSLTDPFADADADGLSNVQEYQAGTNPTNAASVLRIEAISILDDPPRANLRFTATANNTYTVECRNTLLTENWSRLTDLFATATNRDVEVVAPLAPSQGGEQYYRVVTPRRGN